MERYPGLASWSGVASLATTLSVPQYSLGAFWNGSQSIYHLGTWAANLGGNVLKLNVLSTAGLTIAAQTSIVPANVRIIDLTIYFSTTTASGYVAMPNGTFICGTGWGVSTHTAFPPGGLWVTSTATLASFPNPLATFDFYVSLPAYAGLPAMTAVTAASWTAAVNPTPISLPAGALKLPIASAMNSLCSQYVTL